MNLAVSLASKFNLLCVSVSVVGALSATATATAIPVARRRCKSMLSLQKLEVYKCSIEFVAVATAAGEAVPRGYSELREQVRRAAIGSAQQRLREPDELTKRMGQGILRSHVGLRWSALQ